LKKNQQRFLYIAVPVFAVAVLSSLVSLWLSGMVTMCGLLAFSYFYSRPTRTLALMPCAFCDRKIIFEHEGEFCPTCDGAIHGKCMDEHRMSHAKPPEQPFR
jgi:hypothetical protein